MTEFQPLVTFAPTTTATLPTPLKGDCWRRELHVRNSDEATLNALPWALVGTVLGPDS